MHSLSLCQFATIGRSNVANGVHEHYAGHQRQGIRTGVRRITQQGASTRAGKQVATVMAATARIAAAAAAQIDMLYSPVMQPPSNTWFLGPREFAPRTASRSVEPFLQGSRSSSTERERNRKTTLRHDVCRNGPHLALFVAMRVNNCINFISRKASKNLSCCRETARRFVT